MPANRHCSPPWSWESGPSVDPPRIRRWICNCRTWPGTSPPASSEVAHPVSSAALRLSWVLSTQLTTLGSCGGGFTPSSETTFCSGSSTPALSRNALQPSEPPQIEAAFWYIRFCFLKMGVLRRAPSRPFFQKMTLRTYPSSVMYVVSTPLAARPGVGTRVNKKRTREYRVRLISVLHLLTNHSKPLILEAKNDFVM